MLWRFSNQPIGAILSILIFIIAFAKWFKTSNQFDISPNTKTILIWFAFPFLSMFIVSFWIPMFLDRYLVFVSMGFYTLLAISANYIIKDNKYSFVIPLIITLSFALTFKSNTNDKHDAKTIVSVINEIKEKESLVIICPYQYILNFTYYYKRDIFRDFDKINIYENMTNKLFPHTSMPLQILEK